MIAKDLAYVALVANDVAPVCELFEHVLGLARTDVVSGTGAPDVPVFTVGRSSLAIFGAGDPLVGGETRPGVHHIALAVDRVGETADELMSRGVGPVLRQAAPGLGGGATYAIDAAATCGVRTLLTEPLRLKAHASDLIERIDHLGVASSDIETPDAVFARKLGFEVESRQTDAEMSMAVESFTSSKYGVVYHARKPEPVASVGVLFITVGDCELEFIANMDPNQGANQVDHGRPGNTRQDQAAIARFIQTRGAGLHHFAFKTTDIKRALAAAAEAKFPLIDTVGRPGSRRAQIGFLHPRGTGGILMHFVERT